VATIATILKITIGGAQEGLSLGWTNRRRGFWVTSMFFDASLNLFELGFSDGSFRRGMSRPMLN
jgi:hypothetical protein